MVPVVVEYSTARYSYSSAARSFFYCRSEALPPAAFLSHGAPQTKVLSRTYINTSKYRSIMPPVALIGRAFFLCRFGTPRNKNKTSLVLSAVYVRFEDVCVGPQQRKIISCVRRALYDSKELYHHSVPIDKDRLWFLYTGTEWDKS